jgi:hypothetical protein
MPEQTQVQMPADKPAKQDHSPQKNSLGFVKMTTLDNWQSIFILMYVAITASMIFWAASYDLLT